MSASLLLFRNSDGQPAIDFHYHSVAINVASVGHQDVFHVEPPHP